MLNGLGSTYHMFATVTLRPPLPDYSELMSMLHSYENRVLLQDSIASTQQVAFIANNSKSKQSSPKFSSDNSGFTPTMATGY